MRVFKIMCSATSDRTGAESKLHRNSLNITAYVWHVWHDGGNLGCIFVFLSTSVSRLWSVLTPTQLPWLLCRRHLHERHMRTQIAPTNKTDKNTYVFPKRLFFLRKFRRRLFECSLFLLNITSSKNKQAKPTILLLMPGNKINFRMTKENAFNYVWASENQPARCWRWD